MAKTIIVGGGINGILLGALLAREGDEVLLFEKNRVMGGRAFLWEKEGFSVDYGVHLTRFGPGSAVARIMRHLGCEVKYRKMGRSYVMDEDGTMKLFPTSPAGIFRSELFSFTEKLRIVCLLLQIKRGKYDDMLSMSLEDWMREHRVTGGIRKYFELISASVMVCPFTERTSAGEMFRNLHKILKTGHSAEYPADGWKPIHETAVSWIKKQGSLFAGQKVDQVLINRGRAVGVMSGGRKYAADRVVVNLPVQEMFSLIPEKELDSGYVRLCKNLIPTSGVFLDLALDTELCAMDGLLYTMKPMAYGLITSNLCEAVAPKGKQLLTMFYPTSYEDAADPARAKVRREELWDAVHSYFPAIDKHILWKRETALKMVDGVQVNVDQTEDRRPGPRVPGIEGLFLVGDSIAAPGAGGDVGNESVMITYKAMTGRTL